MFYFQVSRRPAFFVMLMAAIGLEAMAANAVEPDGPVVVERRRFYALDARDVTELRRQLDERGPRSRFGHPASALTRHDVVAEYVVGETGAGCVLSDIRVRIDIDIQLPQWLPKRVPPAALAEQWLRLEAALTEHELGHRDNGVWAAGEFLRRLRELQSAPDCENMAADAKNVRLALVAELQAREEDFDLRSDFSRIQQKPHAEERARAEADKAERADRERNRARQQLKGF